VNTHLSIAKTGPQGSPSSEPSPTATTTASGPAVEDPARSLERELHAAFALSTELHHQHIAELKESYEREIAALESRNAFLEADNAYLSARLEMAGEGTR
jgi:hypothetical protein